MKEFIAGLFISFLVQVCIAQQKIPTLLETDHKFGQSDFEKKTKDDIQELFTKKYKYGQIYTHPELTAYLESIVDALKPQSLSDIPTPVVVSNSPVVNAMMFVDGTILVHLGLLVEMQSEDELAFVFAHELAHLILRHGLKNYLSGEKYEKKKAKSPAAMRRWVKSYTSFSQEAELEADSMAVVLLQHSKYNPHATIRALNILTEDDSTIQKIPKIIRLLTGISETPSTHPPKSIRVEHVNKLLKTMPDEGVVTSAETYQKIMAPYYVVYAQQFSRIPASPLVLIELDNLLEMEQLKPDEYANPIRLVRAGKLLDLFGNRDEGAYKWHYYLYSQGHFDKAPKINLFNAKITADYEWFDKWMAHEKKQTKEQLLKMTEQEDYKSEAYRLLGLFAYYENNPTEFKEYITTYLHLQPNAKDAFYFNTLLKRA